MPNMLIICYCPWLCPLHLGIEVCSAQMFANIVLFYLDTITLSLQTHTSYVIRSWKMGICQMRVIKEELIKHYEKFCMYFANLGIEKHWKTEQWHSFAECHYSNHPAATSALFKEGWILDKNLSNKEFFSGPRMEPLLPTPRLPLDPGSYGSHMFRRVFPPMCGRAGDCLHL